MEVCIGETGPLNMKWSHWLTCLLQKWNEPQSWIHCFWTMVCLWLTWAVLLFKNSHLTEHFLETLILDLAFQAILTVFTWIFFVTSIVIRIVLENTTVWTKTTWFQDWGVDICQSVNLKNTESYRIIYIIEKAIFWDCSQRNHVAYDNRHFWNWFFHTTDSSACSFLRFLETFSGKVASTAAICSSEQPWCCM